MSIRDRARAHGALSVPARLDILDRLRASPDPLDAQALAAATGLHMTTVRSHLDALIEAGFVVSHRRPPQGRGRPRTLYAPRTRERSGGSYQELSALLAAYFGDTPAERTRRAHTAGRAWAGRLLDPAPGPDHSPGDARQVVAGLFTEIGFDPEPASAGRLLLHDCPFRDTARAHPDVVCAAHQGLLAGLMARLDPAAPTPVLQPFVRPDLCVAHFGDAPSEPRAS